MKKLVKRFLLIGTLCILIVVGILGYSFFIEPNRLVVHDYDLTYKVKNNAKEIKIVQLSDLHMSEAFDLDNLERVVEEVNSQKPDIILFTGDLFDNYSLYPYADDVQTRLAKLSSTHGKYAIWGNRDYGGGAVRVYESIMQKAGFTILRNESTTISIQGQTMLLQGLDDALMGAVDVKSLQVNNAADYRIMMAHEPDIVDEFKNEDVDLFLSGHSHGGQIRLPFQDIIYTSMAQKYKRGFYTMNEEKASQLYVHSGIGTTKIHARFLVPPSIAVFHLYG